MPKTKRTDLDREIARAENDVVRAKERVARLRRRRPPEPVADYTLLGPGGAKVNLSQAFDGHDDLIVIHNMGRGCPYCTMWADGFNGVLPHLESRAAFVVVSPDPPAEQTAFARTRGWRFRMLSSHGSTFVRDMGFASPEGNPRPGVSVFHRESGRITRTSRTRLGPGDDFCSVWHFFDLLRGGRGDWKPRFGY